MVKLRSIGDLREIIAEKGYFAFDFEAESTTGSDADAKNPQTARATLLSVACDDRVGVWSITPEVISFFQEITSNPEYKAVVHNARYDCVLAHYNGIQDFSNFKAKILDTVQLCWAFEEEEPHGLKYLVKKYLNYTMVTYDEATKDNPLWVRREEVKRELKELDDCDQSWRGYTAKARRPFPTFSGPPKTWAKIRRELTANVKFMNAVPKEELLSVRDWLFSPDQKERFSEHRRIRRNVLLAEQAHLTAELEKKFRKYAADDTYQLVRLVRVAFKKLCEENIWDWCETVEAEVRAAYIEAEIEGICIDVDHLRSMAEKLTPIVEELLNEVHELSGAYDWSPSSTKDLPRVLYLDMGITPPMHEYRDDGKWYCPKLSKLGEEYVEKTGERPDSRYPESISPYIREFGLSTAREVLEMFDHPIGQAILNWRVASKLESTYIKGYLPRLDASEDKRLHGVLNSTGAKTGRSSCSDPNLQQVPSRGKGGNYDERIANFGMELRDVFIAPPPDEEFPEGYDMIVSDQSQIELRFIAHFSDDFKLKQVYNEAVAWDGLVHYVGDVHARTSADLGIKRKHAKCCNFSLTYGTGAPAFARLNGMVKPGTHEYDVDTAELWKRKFLNNYVGIARFTQEMRDMWDQGVREFTTIAGRKRRFWGKVSPGTIVNARIQGSSADLLKVNIWFIRKFVQPLFPGLKLIFQVHDELGYICPKRYSKQAGVLIKYVMEYPFFPLKVPVLASAKVCHSWAAKDDEDSAEIGVLYAKIAGVEAVFDDSNWAQFVAADEAGTVEAKGACSMLTKEQLEYCAKMLPNLPLPTGRLAT